MDFGRYKYELSKKTKLAKQKSHQVKLKTIKFRTNSKPSPLSLTFSPTGNNLNGSVFIQSG